MKKILLILFCIFPMVVHAAYVNVDVSCPKTVLRPDETTNCTIIGNTDLNVVGIDFNYEVGDYLTVEDYGKTKGIWGWGDFSENDATLITKTTDNGPLLLTGKFTIGSVVIKANKNISGDSVNSFIKVKNVVASTVVNANSDPTSFNGNGKTFALLISKTASNTSSGGNNSGGTGTGNTNTNTSVNTTTNTATNTTKPSTNTNTNTNTNQSTNTASNVVTNKNETVNNTTKEPVSNTTTEPEVTTNTPNNVIESITNQTKKIMSLNSSNASTNLLSLNNVITLVAFIAIFVIGVFIGIAFGKKQK